MIEDLDALWNFGVWESQYPKTDFRPLGREVAEDDDGVRIDAHLADKFRFLSRNAWQKRLKKKEVLVNGRAVHRAFRVKVGDVVCYYQPAEHEPEVNSNLEVIWQDGGVMGVYKPSNLPMHEAGAFRRNTFAEFLKQQIGEEWAAVHRLDRETSGIVVCGNEPELRADLAQMLRARSMQKTYLAIAIGVPEEDEWDVDAPIGDTLETKFRVKKWVVPDGLPSQTHFKVLERTKTHTLMQVSPKTGRTHQIRVHSAWCGLPLVGDPKYYPDEDIYLEFMDHGRTENVMAAIQGERLCLHAKNICFDHPVTGEEVLIETEMPSTMQDIWSRLKHG